MKRSASITDCSAIESRGLWQRVEPLLTRVERPVRYIDGEYGAQHKEDTDPHPSLHIGLCYPAAYELGQSNQALQILYAHANQLAGVAAERVFLPGADMSALLRTHDIPLFTLESCTAVGELDLLGITLPYELSFPAVLEILDLSKLPLYAKDRDATQPLILVGGPAAYNPEALAPFVDAVFLGEADGGALTDILQALQKLKVDAQPPVILDSDPGPPTREQQLRALAVIPGVYVPALYDRGEQQGPITRRIVSDFNATECSASSCALVPYAELIHDRLTVEVRRGCTRGCRFCQAGIVYRPVRERDADKIVAAATNGIERSGFDEVSLTSLSTTDYTLIEEVLQRLKRRFAGTGVAVSIPSLRVDNFSVDLARILSDSGGFGAAGANKKTSLTFAPEAGTQRLRDVINKNVNEQQLLDTVAYAFASGWNRLKLYFMIGLPTETDEDVAAIGTLVRQVLDTARDSAPADKRGSVQISVSVSTFVPKAHTPFQWEPQLLPEETLRRQKILQDTIPRKGIKLSWHDAEASFIEGLIARGSRSTAPLIEAVWRASQSAAAYTDRFNYEHWANAAATLNQNLQELVNREFSTDKPLPWDHLHTGVSKDWLIAQRQAAYAQQTTPDCSTGVCTNCDVCQNLAVQTELAL